MVPLRSLRRTIGLVLLGAIAVAIWMYLTDFSSEPPLDFSLTLQYFQSSASRSGRDHALNNLRDIQEVCSKANITFMLYRGTLIGAYRHHGFVPWDDDIDILFNSSEKSRVKGALESLKGYQLYSREHSVWKFYNESYTNLLPNHLQKSSYIDIFFFAENETHIWDELKQYEKEFVFKKADVFPLRRGTFEDLVFPVPCDAEAVLSQTYTLDVCICKMGYDNSNYRPVDFVAQELCSRLKPYFPFVERRDIHAGDMMETLKVGNTVIHSTKAHGYC